MTKPAVTVSKLIDIVIFLAPRDFKECLMSVWNNIFSPRVQKLWPFVGLCWLFFPFHNLASGLELGVPRVSRPSRSISNPPGRRSAPPSLGRQRVPTGSPTSRDAHVHEQFGRALGEKGQAGGGRTEVCGAERWPSWQCQDGGISRVARTRDG